MKCRKPHRKTLLKGPQDTDWLHFIVFGSVVMIINYITSYPLSRNMRLIWQKFDPPPPQVILNSVYFTQITLMLLADSQL